MEMFGRRTIYTAEEKITRDNLLSVLQDALSVHTMNASEIDELWRYTRGDQPVLNRKKKVRPDICNRVVENHAMEIAQFTSGYFLGEPVTYIRRGERTAQSDALLSLNDNMHLCGKASHDKNMSMWMAVCGVGYRMLLPVKSEDGGSPFAIETPDPRSTFVVYYSGFGGRRMLGARQIVRRMGDIKKTFVCGYTDTHYFEVCDGKILKFEHHALGCVPIFQYRLNMAQMGSFEAALPLLNAINTIQSNRVDGIEQFVQAFLKFKNCRITQEDLDKFAEEMAIMLPPNDMGRDADVDFVSAELNQTQTQTLVDYLYDQVLAICGLPTSTKGGASTSDTGAAVFLRDGWSQCEARARDTELLFKESEREFLALVLSIMRKKEDGFDLRPAEVECKFTRRQHDNLQSKTQALITMLEAGVEPSIAFATSGLFNDPMDVATASAPYLKKWEYADIDEVTEDADAV
ncbi:MAG: phage portal protein [Clostridia bacterium]|nr:phage portal protein [Clostridia bacterium]